MFCIQNLSFNKNNNNNLLNICMVHLNDKVIKLNLGSV